jgi:hypothetical protein
VRTLAERSPLVGPEHAPSEALAVAAREVGDALDLDDVHPGLEHRAAFYWY